MWRTEYPPSGICQRSLSGDTWAVSSTLRMTPLGAWRLKHFWSLNNGYMVQPFWNSQRKPGPNTQRIPSLLLLMTRRSKRLLQSLAQLQQKHEIRSLNSYSTSLHGIASKEQQQGSCNSGICSCIWAERERPQHSLTNSLRYLEKIQRYRHRNICLLKILHVLKRLSCAVFNNYTSGRRSQHWKQERLLLKLAASFSNLTLTSVMEYWE